MTSSGLLGSATPGNLLLAGLPGPLGPSPSVVIVHGGVTTGRGDAGLRRQPPIRPHLAPPLVVGATPLVPLVLYEQGVKRGEQAFAERFLPYRAHIPQPFIARGPPAPRALVLQAISRALIARGGHVRLAPPVPFFLAPAPFITQASAPLARTTSRPHLAPAVLAFGRVGATIIVQALRRPYIGREPLHPRRATSAAFPPSPRPSGLFISPRARGPRGGHVSLVGPVLSPVTRATIILTRPLPLASRQALRPHLPVVSTASSVPAGHVLLASERVTERRLRDIVSAPKLAPTLLSPTGPRATIHLAKPTPARSGRLWLPRPAVTSLVPGTFVYQRRVARAVLRPHLARPVLALAHRPATLIIGQARNRPLLGRKLYRTRVAPPLPLHNHPRAPYTKQGQALARALIGRGGHVHLARPAPAPPVPLGRIVLASERVTERRLRDVPPPPRLASPNLALRGPGATLQLQRAQQLARGGRVHLAPATPPVSDALSVPAAVLDLSLAPPTPSVILAPSSGTELLSAPPPVFTITLPSESGGGAGGGGGGGGRLDDGGFLVSDAYIMISPAKLTLRAPLPNVVLIDGLGDSGDSDEEEEEIIILALRRFGMI